METTANLSFLYLILNASLFVQLIMFILVISSIVSWGMIFNKYVMLRLAKRKAEDFESIFWSRDDLVPLYNTISKSKQLKTGMEKIFEAGFKEFSRLRGREKTSAESILEGSQRSMRIAMNKEIDALETNLSFFATIGSTSPYIGLLGTVWGIMNSFRALGNVQQASIALVAPGIAEALIATAMGLFAAIPAVIAYNRYSNDIEGLVSRYDIFMEEFSSILHRHAHS